MIWAARLIQREAEADLAAIFPFYRRGDLNQRVSSFWIQRAERSTSDVQAKTIGTHDRDG